MRLLFIAPVTMWAAGVAVLQQRGIGRTVDREIVTTSVPVALAVVAMGARDVRLDDAGVAGVDDRHVHVVTRMI
jgi:hypothetical protein